MTYIIAVLGFMLLLMVLWDAFEVIILPRSVTSYIGLARVLYRITWRLTKTIDERMVARTAERGWSMHYLHHADNPDMDGWKPIILKTPGKFVLEHMGGVDPTKGINGEGFKFVLQALDTGRCWLKRRTC